MKAKVHPGDALAAEEIEGTDHSSLVYDTPHSACVSPRGFRGLSDNSPFVADIPSSATPVNAVPSDTATSQADHSPSAILSGKRRGTDGEANPAKKKVKG
jgi:hypothetical protein